MQRIMNYFPCQKKLILEQPAPYCDVKYIVLCIGELNKKRITDAQSCQYHNQTFPSKCKKVKYVGEEKVICLTIEFRAN